MLPSIPSENSGGLEATRSTRAAERTTQSVAQAPQNADAGEVDRSRRVDGVELTRRGERLADARRRARDDDRGAAPDGDAEVDRGVARERDDAQRRGLEENEDAATERARDELAPVPRPSADRAAVSSEDLGELRDLQRSDRQVRVQENLQRQMAAGFVRGAPVYEYEEGPDGRRYAVAADTEFELPDARAGDPREAARDAANARRAALASAISSPAEQAFAARAASAEARARAEITREVAIDTSVAARRRAAQVYEESRGRVGGSADAADTSAA